MSESRSRTVNKVNIKLYTVSRGERGEVVQFRGGGGAIKAHGLQFAKHEIAMGSMSSRVLKILPLIGSDEYYHFV